MDVRISDSLQLPTIFYRKQLLHTPPPSHAHLPHTTPLPTYHIPHIHHPNNHTQPQNYQHTKLPSTHCTYTLHLTHTPPHIHICHLNLVTYHHGTLLHHIHTHQTSTLYHHYSTPYHHNTTHNTRTYPQHETTIHNNTQQYFAFLILYGMYMSSSIYY